MEFLEWLYYESLPYVYAGLSIFAFMNASSSKVTAVAAVVLAFCSYVVLTKRYQHRNFTSKYRNNIRL